MKERIVITGAFSYTGAAVARELLKRGWEIHTLTNRSRPPEIGNISSSPLRFDLEYLKQNLAGANIFINTYWVRLPWNNIDFQTAIENSHRLILAAVEAKVPRLVHVSVSSAEQGQNRQQNLPLVQGNGRANRECYPHDDQCSPCRADQVV